MTGKKFNFCDQILNKCLPYVLAYITHGKRNK